MNRRSEVWHISASLKLPSGSISIVTVTAIFPLYGDKWVARVSSVLGETGRLEEISGLRTQISIFS